MRKVNEVIEYNTLDKVTIMDLKYNESIKCCKTGRSRNAARVVFSLINIMIIIRSNYCAISWCRRISMLITFNVFQLYSHE